MKLEKYKIRHHNEETQCESCGYPLYTDDSAYMTESGHVYCGRTCAADDVEKLAARTAEYEASDKANADYWRKLAATQQPAEFKGEPFTDPAPIAAKAIVERELARPKYAELQCSLMPDVPDAAGQISLF